MLVNQILDLPRPTASLMIHDIDGILIGRVLLCIQTCGDGLILSVMLNIPRWIGSFPVMMEARVGVHIGDT